MLQAAITAERSSEILTALADYHGILSAPHAPEVLPTLVRGTEQQTINSFYAYFPQCHPPTETILLCIIEELRCSALHRRAT